MDKQDAALFLTTAPLSGRQSEWGVLNMRQISEFIAGRLQIETAPGQGTTIRVELARSNIAMDQGELA